MRWVLLLCVGLLLAMGCGDDAKDRLTPPTSPDYLANDSPDNLIANLKLAMEAMDAEGYAALLYNDTQLATDGAAYAAYKFYFDRSWDPSLPEFDLYDRDLVRMGAFLGGEPGMDSNSTPVPGVRAIDLDLLATGAWAAPLGDAVEDDPFPAGTVQRFYEFDLLITLKATYGQDTNAWLVQDRLRVHCIPVQVGGETEWRLWKWRDIIDSGKRESRSRTEDSSYSSIKALY